MSDLESYRLQRSEDAERWPHAGASRTVHTPDLQWHVQVMGSGPELLLLHGAGGSSHSWAGLLGPLSEEYRVVVPDLPGHAFTTALPADRCRLPDIATAVTRFLDAVDARPTGIVTHSAGAAVALFLIQTGALRPRAWAAVAPSLVRPSRGVPPPFVQDLLAPAFRTAGLSLLASALGRRHFVTDSLLKSTGSDVPPWSRRVYRKLMGNPAHVGAVLQLMAAWDPDPVSRRLPEVDVPGLVIAGEADHWIPMKDVTAAVDRLPDVELHVLPGRGHVLHEEAPREVFTLLHPFLRKHLLPEPNDTPVG